MYPHIENEFGKRAMKTNDEHDFDDEQKFQ